MGESDTYGLSSCQGSTVKQFLLYKVSRIIFKNASFGPPHSWCNGLRLKFYKVTESGITLQRNIGSLWNFRIKLKRKYVTTKKISWRYVFRPTHMRSKCAHMRSNCNKTCAQVYASVAQAHAWIFMKFFFGGQLQSYELYSLKFHNDSRFWWGVIPFFEPCII